MGHIRTITRRTFMIGSAALAGGVAFGVYQVRRTPTNPLLEDLKSGEVAFNPWVKIDATGITLIAPHTDLGQGARSVQAMLIAEELDLEFGQFKVEPGPPSAAYWNTAAVNDAVPFLHQDTSFMAESARGIVGSVLKVLGLQVTGGSSTVVDSYDKLRLAGAVARETLKRAASIKTGIAEQELRTSKATVILPDGTEFSYLSLAAEAADIDPVSDVALRDPSQWRLIGKDVIRLDMAAKSMGTLDYGIDLVMDGMVNATVRFNPKQGGAMLAFDSSRAEKMPGVLNILQVSNGVAVVADNTWNAFQAAYAIVFEWGEADYPTEMDQHWDKLSASFNEDHLDKEWRHDGDVPGSLDAAENVLDLEYRAPYLAHAPLEPISALVLVDDDRADIWVAHQFPRFAEQMVAEITGLDIEQVHLHNQYCGGSFGHRLEFENVRYATEVATQMKGTPVKLTFSREEDFAHDFPRQIAMGRVKGVSTEGRVNALDISVASPAVMNSQFARMGLPAAGPDNQIPAGIWNAPYDVAAMRVRAYRVDGLAPTSSWRSVGASSGGFFIESAMDELILAGGGDPLEERLRLCNDQAARAVLEAVGKMSNWGSDLGPDRGRGLAMVVSFGTPVAEVVEVTNTPKGIRIDKVYVAAEVGHVIDPINFDNQVKGGIIWGLGHAMNCEITYSKGMAQQTNYHAYQGMRLNQCPEIEVMALENGPGVRGIGEPPVPPAAPALANAIFAATGQRLREMPFNQFIDFV